VSERGSDDGFDCFYRETYPRLVVSLRLAIGSTEASEDVAQEAFARTLARWARVRRGSNPAGYVYRVAFRLHNRSLVRRRREYGDALTQSSSTTPRPGSSELWAEVAAIREAFTQLPFACRRAAALCLYAEFTAEEAAAVLDVSASTVRTQVQRARELLVAAVRTDENPFFGVTVRAPRRS
jgi:RNA polymerase sigma factor (sigma-70 family)